MAKTIRVIIGGKEYSLRGDNENFIQSAASEVNKQMEALGNRHDDESTTTISVLAALNIAETHYKELRQTEIDHDFLFGELNSMADYMMKTLNIDNRQVASGDIGVDGNNVAVNLKKQNGNSIF